MITLDLLIVFATKLIELFLAIREDMTPDQRKAFWLLIERVQKQIEDAQKGASA